MDLFEWYELKKNYRSLSREEFIMKAYNKHQEELRSILIQNDKELFEKKAIQQIDTQIDKKLDKAIGKALKSGFSEMNIKITI